MGPSPSKRDDWLDEPICDSHAVQQLFSTSIAEVRRLPGWTWGVQVTGIGDAPPPVWPPELWLFVETAAMRHGLVVFNTAGAPRGLAAAPRGEPVDALRAHLLHVVLREQRAAARTGWSWDNHDLRATGGPFEAVFASVYDAYSREEFARCCAVLEAVAGALQRTLCDRPHADAAAALARVVAAIVETRAHRLQFGNTRYCIAKHFGYVLPTRALVRWLCDQFAGCERVVSVGAGSCFLEAAMQLEMRARGRATVLVCVENNVELIGHPAREAAAERSVEMVALGPDAAEGAGEHDNASTATGLRGFCCSPMKVVPSLPAAQPLRPADGLLVSWGRAVAEGERPEDNPWSVCEHAAARGEGAGVAVVIGGTDARWFRCDTFCGATLQGAAPPDGANAPTCARFADGREATWDGRPSSADGVPLVGYHGIGDHAVRRRARLLTKPPGPPSRARRRL